MAEIEQESEVLALNDQWQAILYHSRERRRSLLGIPELFQTHLFGIPSSIPAAAFPERDVLVTFWTAFRVTTALPVGMLFEYGDASNAVAAWVENDRINFRAGGALAADRALAAAVYPGGNLPVGLELVLQFSVRPGDGRVRIWSDKGNEIARDTASGGGFPAGWASQDDGSFASAASGPLPADVAETGPPTNFELIAPLRVYMKQVPRHFI